MRRRTGRRESGCSRDRAAPTCPPLYGTRAELRLRVPLKSSDTGEGESVQAQPPRCGQRVVCDQQIADLGIAQIQDVGVAGDLWTSCEFLPIDPQLSGNRRAREIDIGEAGAAQIDIAADIRERHRCLVGVTGVADDQISAHIQGSALSLRSKLASDMSSGPMIFAAESFTSCLKVAVRTNSFRISPPSV